MLKCPDHIFALAAIREVYPDARLVFVHRDPLAVLSSVARLTGVLRRPFARHIDKFEIGRDDSARWLAATGLMIAAAEEAGFAEPIFHVHYHDLTRDPPATVAAIYRHFGMALTPETDGRIRQLVTAKPDGGYGARRYHFADHGLDAARERERFSRYTEYFRVRREVEIGPMQPASAAATPARRQSAASAD